MRAGLLTMEVLGIELSLGEFAKNGTLTLREQMVNPYTYTRFIVTEEPFEDADPNAGGLLEEHSFRRLLDVNSIIFLNYFIFHSFRFVCCGF